MLSLQAVGLHESGIGLVGVQPRLERRATLSRDQLSRRRRWDTKKYEAREPFISDDAFRGFFEEARRLRWHRLAVPGNEMTKIASVSQSARESLIRMRVERGRCNPRYSPRRIGALVECGGSPPDCRRAQTLPRMRVTARHIVSSGAERREAGFGREENGDVE